MAVPTLDFDERVHGLIAGGGVGLASELVLRELGPAILRYVRSAVRDEELAADAFSEFAEDLWRGLPSFRGDSSLKTWAYRVAWNAVLRVRNDTWQRRRSPLPQSRASGLAEQLRTCTPVVRERQAKALEALRAKLSLEDQSLLALRVDQGLSWAEVAEIVATNGEPVQVDALMKRFQRLKERIGIMARAEGLVE
jgi:RNA polymerase sigma-70 factor (ECF subfamily)